MAESPHIGDEPAPEPSSAGKPVAPALEIVRPRAKLRTFPEAVERLATEWRIEIETREAWEITGPVGSGRDGARFVRLGSVVGVAKPRSAIPAIADLPRAAHEKIAADLAHDLGLPVPPATLWRRGKVPHGEERLMSISAVPFADVFTWGQLEGHPRVRSPVLAEISRAASAMVALDVWLSNMDRVNDGNLLVATAYEGEAHVVRWAFIDYSNSLLFAWRDEDARSLAPPGGLFPSDAKLIAEALDASVAAIEAFSAASLGEIVNRIPDEFLSATQKATILRTLLARQALLPSLLKTAKGEIE